MSFKLSIITATYNSGSHLEQTITSIQDQTYKNIEHIIIDGGSTDSTLEVIDKFDSAISYFVSEPDKGISDAMSKGLNVACGDFILFLHSDDYFINSSVLAKAFTLIDGSSELYFFDVILESNYGRILSKSKPFGWWTNFKMGACHQGQFVSKSLFNKLGGFDTTYKYTMDYDFIMRAYRSGSQSTVINMPLSVMRLTGISSKRDWASLKERFDEERRVHMKYCPSMFMRIVYYIYWSSYIPYRRCRSYLDINNVRSD